MFRLTILFALVFTLLNQNISHAQMRNWTGANGKIIEAEFIAVSDDVVKIKLKDGRIQNVRINLFSEKDRDFVRNQGKTDDPFADSVESKIATDSSATIDMKFVLDEAKKTMARFEQIYPKPLTVGNLSRVYADYAVIQFCAGETKEASASIDKAIKLNEPITNEDCKRYNAIMIAHRAIFIKRKDIAQKIIDEIGVSNVSYSLLFAIGNEIEASLIVAKREGKSKAYGLAYLGEEYLKKGDIAKAKGLLDAALGAAHGDGWFPPFICKKWIKAKRIEEAQEMINGISDQNMKGSLLTELALYYLELGDKERMRSLAVEALLKMNHTHTLVGHIYPYFLMNDLETYRKVRGDIIREMENNANIPFANPMGSMRYLTQTYQQEMIVDGTITPREMFNRIEKVLSSREEMKPNELVGIYRLIAHTTMLFDDTKVTSDVLKKMERCVEKIEDSDSKKFFTKDVERFKSNSNDPYPVMNLIYEGFPVLIRSGQSERIKPILDRIKLPQAKIDALRIIAETLQKK